MIDRMPLTRSLEEMLKRSCNVAVYQQGFVLATAKPPFLVIGIMAGEIEYDESLADDYSSLMFHYTVMSVGKRVDQTEALADRARRTLCQRRGEGWQVDFKDLPGYNVIRRECTLHGQAEPVGQQPNVLLNLTDEYALYTAAA